MHIYVHIQLVWIVLLIHFKVLEFIFKMAEKLPPEIFVTEFQENLTQTRLVNELE